MGSSCYNGLQLKDNGIAYRELCSLCLTPLMIDSNMKNSSAYTVSLGSKGRSRPCTKVFEQDT